MSVAARTEPPEGLVEFFRNSDGFFLLSHLNPDGDTLGAACALGMALKQLGKRSILVCRDAVPLQYVFLPGIERYLTFDGVKSAGVDPSLYSNLVLVDCNEIRRTGLEKSAISSCKFDKIAVIDHHEIENPSGDVTWVVPQITATAMMVYYLVRALGLEMTGPMAVNLYAGLVVDTGNFRFPNTSAEVLRVAADLAEAGAKPSRIYTEINESWTQGRFLLFSRTLSTLTINNGIAVMHVTKKMFEETSTNADDTENFASFALIMKDIKIAVFMREVDNDSYKISLRSVEEINVEKVAAAYKGGGHKNASGCIAKGELGAVKAELITRLSALLYQ